MHRAGLSGGKDGTRVVSAVLVVKQNFEMGFSVISFARQLLARAPEETRAIGGKLDAI